MNELLTLDGFTAWLKEHKPDEVIGRPNDCALCPIALYLREVTGEIAYVEPSGYCVDKERVSPSELTLLPDWASAFVHDVDTSDGYLTVQNLLYFLENYQSSQNKSLTQEPGR